MSSYYLKIIAIITMLIDHIGAIYISPRLHPQAYLLFRGIGRLAFPIFVFLIVEGFHHTRNVKKYLIRLGVFALLSEIPFDLAFYQVRFGRDVITDIKNVFVDGFDRNAIDLLINNFNLNQNIFFTLFLGLLLIYLMSFIDLKFQSGIMINNLLQAIAIIVTCMCAIILKTDYDISGILMILVFYLFRGRKLLLSISLFIICTLLLSDLKTFMALGSLRSVISMFATFAMIPIAFYNGKKGKDVKYFFYIFYPAHLLILFFIQTMI